MQLYKFISPEKLNKGHSSYEFAVYCDKSNVIFEFIRPKGGFLSNPTAEYKFNKIEHWDNPWYKYHLGDIVNLSMGNVSRVVSEPIKIKEMF